MTEGRTDFNQVLKKKSHILTRRIKPLGLLSVPLLHTNKNTIFLDEEQYENS